MNVRDGIDDVLLADAARLTGISERTALLNAALRALIERARARRSRVGRT